MHISCYYQTVMGAYLRIEYNWQLSNKTFLLDYLPIYFVTSMKIKILGTVLSRCLVNCIVGFSLIYQNKTFQNEYLLQHLPVLTRH